MTDNSREIYEPYLAAGIINFEILLKLRKGTILLEHI